IFKSRIPIISGIGHETDTTIADYVSDLRAATPTAAAEHCTPDAQQWLSQFQAYEYQLTQLIQNKLQQHKRHLDWLTKNLNQQHPGKRLQIQAQRLDELELRLKSTVQNQLNQAKSDLKAYQAQLWQFNPTHKVAQLKNRYTMLNNRLNSSIKTTLSEHQQKFTLLSQTLNIVSPLATLSRGYTLTSTKQNALLNSSTQLKVGQIIKTRFASGSVTSQIQEINHE
ncbi:MAG: exodeoxyribonuclease VII large subunit, partial [Methylococcaceae bacterium]|nr:exodeoxyribonuclease VII large subunit [Methylococcaceae bacterium]